MEKILRTLLFLTTLYLTSVEAVSAVRSCGLLELAATACGGLEEVPLLPQTPTFYLPHCLNWLLLASTHNADTTPSLPPLTTPTSQNMAKCAAL